MIRHERLRYLHSSAGNKRCSAGYPSWLPPVTYEKHVAGLELHREQSEPVELVTAAS